MPRGERVPTHSPPDESPACGLPVLPIPDVEGSRAAWIAQLDKLVSRPGADLTLIAEVREWVEHGVRARFPNGPPPPEQHPNTYTFMQHERVCLERMRVYRDLGALRELPEPPPQGGYVQPLHAVVKPGKKARVCVDFSRNFNDFLADQGFQMTSVQAGVELAQQCPTPAFFVKLDISSCFLSFPVHPADYKFFVCQAGGDYYQFLRLAFGLKNAPRVASLLLDVVSAAITDLGVAHIRYLDDFLLVASSAARAWACAHAAAAVLVRFGLALAPDKVEGPAQRLEFLGIVIDSVIETLEISSERQQELQELLTDFHSRRFSSVRRVQSLLGKLSFASQVLPGARPFLRRIIDVIAGKRGGRVRLDTNFRGDVCYWQAHIAQWNGRARWRAPCSDPFVFGSDASISGFAYGLEAGPPSYVPPSPAFAAGAVRMGTWSAAAGHAQLQDTSANIQWGEFFCPLAAAVEFGPLLAGGHVIFMVDNESDVSVINRLRTREPRVAALLRALCDTALRYNFSFAAIHRYGKENVLMDWASRPEHHHFSASPADAAAFVARSSVASRLDPVWGGGLGSARFPPLLIPTRLTHINSRCLSFEAKDSSVSWATTLSGW